MTLTLVTPEKPDTSALAAESSELVIRAKALEVTDNESYLAAAEFGKGIKALQKKIVEFFAKHKTNAFKAWKDLCADEAQQLTPTAEAEQIVKSKMLAWQKEEAARLDKIRREREAAAKKLEEDRRVQEALDLDEDGDRAAAEERLTEPIVAPVIRTGLSGAPATLRIAGVTG